MTRKIVCAAIALFGIVAFAGHAGASCGSSQRVSASDSQCLWETHTNGGWTARNACLHEIKTKIDVKGGSDKTKKISKALFQVCTIIRGEPECFVSGDPDHASIALGLITTRETGSIDTTWGRRIRSVTCCKDHASCNRRSTDTYPAGY